MNVEKNEELCENTSAKTLTEALNFIKTRKTAEPRCITFELLKMCKNKNVKKLAEVVNDLHQKKKIPESWRMSDLKPIHKEKGDVKSCERYRRV